ncbi:MAG: diacylglycerol kinase family protein [Chloroflexota bacterium]|nr:MAG: diacylglycerol kinase family protein [Chloroflexota bacterium]
MLSFIKSRWQSIQYAIQGLKHPLQTEPNTWVHTGICIAVLALGLWLSITPLEWAVILLTMAVVWAAEFFNTALETALDLLHPQSHPKVKIAKDVSAAAVLITAFFSVLIGLLILAPPLWEKVNGWFF